MFKFVYKILKKLYKPFKKIIKKTDIPLKILKNIYLRPIQHNIQMNYQYCIFKPNKLYFSFMKGYVNLYINNLNLFNLVNMMNNSFLSIN